MVNSWLVFGILLILLGFGLAEALGHRRTLRRVPIRIHVNGTRGKSSVTRLIAAGLRAAGIRTCAKTTGSAARIILPDGTDYPVFRPAQPNVIEQVRFIRAAAALDVRAVVVECMALQPHLQWLSEARFIRATHGVITNARPDHLDVMGPTEHDVALALSGMVPFEGVLLTGDSKYGHIFARAAGDRGSSHVMLTPDDISAVTPEEMARFSYVEHEENVALALAVCRTLGIDRGTALRGMWAALPDPGALTIHEMDFFGRRICFVNGFAANDPESARRVWDLALDKFPQVDKRIAVVNCREDRPDRSCLLGRACVQWRPADHYVLVGAGASLFARTAAEHGLDARKLVFAEGCRVDEIFEIVINLAGRSALVMGLGNIGGQGLDLVRFFQNRSIVRRKDLPPGSQVLTPYDVAGKEGACSIS